MGCTRSRQGSAALSHVRVRVWHSGIALGAMLFLMLLASGPAMGASIGIASGTTELGYTADSDEQNNVSVDQLGDGSLTLTSTGTTPLVDGDGAVGCNVVDNGVDKVATC